MEKYYILIDKEKFYVAEGQATYNFEKARKIKSIEELITTIPFMKDWYWDYVLYLVDCNKMTKVDSEEIYNKFRQWEKDCPDDYERVYSASGFHNFIRTTSN